MALWRIRATVDDRPGYLSVLTASLALRGVNILSVQVHTTEAGAVDDFLVDAPDDLDEAGLLAAVERGRGRDCWVARSEARGLVDQPTRVLGLAAWLVRDPRRPDGGAARPCSAPTWSAGGRRRAGRGSARTPCCWPTRPAAVRAAPGRARFHPRRVRPGAGAGRAGGDRGPPVGRPGHPAAARRGGAGGPAGDGGRPAGRAGAARGVFGAQPAAATSAGRPARRRPGCGGCWSRPGADPGRDGHRRGRTAEPVVAMANLLGEGDEAEAALLVRDDWQRRGLGTALLRRLVGHAERAGYAALLLHVQAQNTPMLRTVARLGRPMPSERDGCLLTVTVPLGVVRPRRPGAGARPATLAGPATVAADRPH
ncbi:GNAT family N-acetyltransferase [Micromonospora sp. R77]|uniref:GNAT family N-acetyltransferase n=1 Tax=Micromonospora sp. R77 TaxID=2925836 RepID=UPI0035B01040